MIFQMIIIEVQAQWYIVSSFENSEQKGTVLYVNSFPGRDLCVLDQYILW